MKKFLTLILFLFMLSMTADAKSLHRSFDSLIDESHISKSSVAISIKNTDNGKVVYAQNAHVLMHPASVQKVLTIVPIMDVLGDDYNFKTELYTRGKDGYLIKLGADPYLSMSDLDALVKKIKPNKIKQIYIDNSIIEKKDWGEGWQWDDDLNPYIKRFNSYNLDNNLTKITIMPTMPGKPAFIINPQKSPITFYNNVNTGDKNNIKITRDNIISPNMIKLEGTVNSPVTYSIPNNNLKLYFSKKLTDSLENNNIYLKTQYIDSNQTISDVFVDKIEHSMLQAIDDILLNSNNQITETVAKLAAGKYYNKQGTDIDGVNLFNEYCKKNGIDNSRVRIVDASGVSKNNLIDADFVSEFLIKNKDKKILDKMAVPGEGTMSTRLIPLKENLRAKTGTLSDISSIAGFITTKSGHKYTFCIMINDPVSSDSTKKNLENYLIREMYYRL